MSTKRCIGPLPFDVLVDYWLDDRSPADEGGPEEHLFACEECSARLEDVAALAEGVRRIGEAGRLRGGVGAAILERLQQDGRVIRRYRARAGGHIHCTAGANDDFVVLELSADLAGVERVDLLYCAEDGSLIERATQLPVIRERDVVWVEPGDAIRALPTAILHVRLLAVDSAGERPIGEYTLHHTAYRG